MFSRADLVCPHCRGRSKEPSDACPRCGFGLGACEKAFPFAAPPLSLVIDPSVLLPLGIEEEIQGNYQKVRRSFPQIDFSFCFVRLQPGIAIQEFAFWLHNSAPGADEARAWQILVVGDLTSGRLALTSGYALEPFMKESQWEAALQELAACIADAQWKEGLCGFLVDARDLLTNAWSAAEQRLQRRERIGERSRDEPGAAEEQTAAPSSPATPLNSPAVPAAASAIPPRAPEPETRTMPEPQKMEVAAKS